LSFITPRDGWDESEVVQPQSTVHPALAPRTSLPQPTSTAQPMQQQPVHYVYLPQPQAPQPHFMSQTVVVQNQQSSSGCLWLFVLLLPPLWPIALIIWLVNRSRSSVTVVNSSGYGTQQYPHPVRMPTSAVIAACVLTVLVIAVVAVRNGNTNNGAHKPAVQPITPEPESHPIIAKPQLPTCLTQTEVAYGNAERHSISISSACGWLGDKRLCAYMQYSPEAQQMNAEADAKSYEENQRNCEIVRKATGVQPALDTNSAVQTTPGEGQSSQPEPVASPPIPPEQQQIPAPPIDQLLPAQEPVHR